MNRNRERGQASIVAMLIVMAMLLTLAAMSVPSFKLITQIANESATKINMTNLLQAEQTYFSTYGSVYPASLSYLSACPAAVAGKVTPTATEACLVSPSLTNGQTINGYKITQTLVDTTAGNTGFLLTATPQQQLARVGFCAGSGSESATVSVVDGLLRTGFTSSVPSTLAACMEYPAVNPVAAPAPSSSTTVYTTGLVSSNASNGALSFALAGLPSGSYQITGNVSGAVPFPSLSTTDYAYGQCMLSPGSSGTLPLIDIQTFYAADGSFPYAIINNPNGDGVKYTQPYMALYQVALSGTATVSSGGTVTLSCVEQAIQNGNSSTGGGPYSGIITATPVTSVTTN